MRTRLGHVSNSSSSSFVVLVDDGNGNGFGVAPEQEAALLEYGFRYVAGCYWKTALTCGSETSAERPADGQVALFYDVPCNQEDVEEFLFAGKIPFVESQEYDTRLVSYDGRHEWYERALNEGGRLLMYCFNGSPEADEFEKRLSLSSRPFMRIRISDGADVTAETLGEGGDGR